MKYDVNSSQFDVRFTRLLDRPWLQKTTSMENTSWFMPFNNEHEQAVFLDAWMSSTKHRTGLTITYGQEIIGMAKLFYVDLKKLAHLSLAMIVLEPAIIETKLPGRILRNLEHLGKEHLQLESIYFDIYDTIPYVPILKSEGYSVLFSQEAFAYCDKKPLTRVCYSKDL